MLKMGTMVHGRINRPDCVPEDAVIWEEDGMNKFPIFKDGMEYTGNALRFWVWTVNGRPMKYGEVYPDPNAEAEFYERRAAD